MVSMLRSIAGNHALVTGASRGIGRAIAVMLAEEGCSVALIARSREGLEQTAESCRRHNVEAIPIALDITETTQLQAGIEEAVRKLGGLHILINNAGRGYLQSSLSADPAVWQHVMATNLLAAMETTRLCLPHIKRQGGGSIVFIASISAKIVYAEGAAYCASKHGLLGFAGSVFEDVRRFNIKVCTICPGYVNTEMVSGLGLNKAGVIQAQDVAEAVRMTVKFPVTSCPTEIILRSQHEEV